MSRATSYMRNARAAAVEPASAPEATTAATRKRVIWKYTGSEQERCCESDHTVT